MSSWPKGQLPLVRGEMLTLIIDDYKAIAFLLQQWTYCLMCTIIWIMNNNMYTYLFIIFLLPSELRTEIEKLKTMGYTTRGRKQSDEERKKNDELEGLKERLTDSHRRMAEMEEAWKERVREEETKRKKIESQQKEVRMIAHEYERVKCLRHVHVN